MVKPYYYNAKVLEVYDGDTITTEIDLGFSIKMKVKIRLANIDTPEVKGSEKSEGIKVREYLREMILGRNIVLETIKDSKSKYGRILGIIHLDGLNINQHLINEGLAKRYEP